MNPNQPQANPAPMPQALPPSAYVPQPAGAAPAPSTVNNPLLASAPNAALPHAQPMAPPAPAGTMPAGGAAPFTPPFMQHAGPAAAGAPGALLPAQGAGMMIGGAAAPAAGKPGQQGAPQPRTNPNSTQNALQIAEIRDGIVIMNDGTFRSVVMVKSINFDLMSQQEQEAVEYSYQGFLNSLYFPIQIFIRSQKVDLQPYIEKLDKIRTEHDNMLLALLMEDYITYIDQLSQQTNIMDKRFYAVIPYSPVIDGGRPSLAQSKTFLTGLVDMFSSNQQHVTINEGDLEAAKTELRNRVQAVLSGLLQCGIQGLPLDTQELIELYYDTYNPDTATRQELKNFNDLTADVITKGEGAAPQAHLQRELQ